MRRIGTRVVAHMQHGLCALALTSWAHQCRLMARVRAVALRWSHRHTMACFDAWFNVVQESQQAQVQESQQAQMAELQLAQIAELQQEGAPGPAGARTTPELEANIKFLEALVDELFQALGSPPRGSGAPNARSRPSEGLPERSAARSPMGLSPMHQ